MLSLFLILDFINKLEFWAWANRCAQPSQIFLCVCFHEQNWIEQCPSEFAPILYKRYIEDTFVLFKDKAHVDLFLNCQNSQHTSINFTMELENNNKLPFLDCLVIKEYRV